MSRTSTLLLRLAAPMQSWGSARGKFDHRPTEAEPTRSGIIGMIAGALGFEREDSLDVFEKLKIGVRIDQRGEQTRDFHMVHQYNAKTKRKESSWVTYRYYLCDAVFLVGIEGEEPFVQEIMKALQFPVYPIYLGRRSCPPEGNLVLGIRTGLGLQQALVKEPWIAQEWYKQKMRKKSPIFLEIVRDTMEAEAETYTMRDNPVSFSQEHRKHKIREVFRDRKAVKICDPQDSLKSIAEIQTNHDPLDF